MHRICKNPIKKVKKTLHDVHGYTEVVTVGCQAVTHLSDKTVEARQLAVDLGNLLRQLNLEGPEYALRIQLISPLIRLLGRDTNVVAIRK